MQPNVYRLMQLGRQFIPTAAKFDHVFSKNMKRNRVELVSDFPNDAEVISSLQVCYHSRSYFICVENFKSKI